MSTALARDPGNVELLSRAFTLAISGGDMESALDLGPRLQSAAPDHQMSALLLALEEARRGEFGVALAQLQAIEPYGVAQFILPLVEAWMHHALGNEADAVAALAPMREMNGFGSLANLHRGLILDSSGDLDGALAALTEARELGSALRLVQALGSVYERLGQTEQARDLYQTYAEENRDSLMVEPALARIEAGRTAPRLVDEPAEGIAEALFHIATALNQEGGSELALLIARMTLHLKPDFPLAELLLAETMVRGERHQEALDVFESIDPDVPAYWSARLSASNALDELDRQPEAIDLLRELAQQRTDRSAPLVRMGDLLRGESRFDEAIEAYDAALARSPELAESDWTFLYKRGIALERAKEWERAERDLIQAIDLNPTYAHLLNYLGYSWIDRGENLAEGEELIREAVNLEPNDGFIIDSLGWAYYRTGRMEEAVEALERAVALRPEDPVINDHLGDAYWMVGRRTEARYQWVRAQRTADDDEELLLAIEDKLANGLSAPDLIEGPQTAGQPAVAAPN
jgi:tetratricopeptide (TPR) repeat protein